MSDVIITYAQQNKQEKYNLLTSSEQRSVSSVTANFIQELVTKRGSNVFEREYGTLFIDNLGSQANVHKINYFLKQEITKLREKYSIVSGLVTKAWTSPGSGILNIEMTIEFNDVMVSSYVDFRFNGSFTDKDIIEYT